MDQSLLEILGLAFVAGFFLLRLYMTLGKRTGAERPLVQPAQGELPRTAVQPRLASPLAGPGQASEGLMAIVRADPRFDIAQFLTGARKAYELTVGAFGKGDRDALRPLVTPRVYEMYVSAITAREAKSEAGPELVRLKSADLVDASMHGDMARVVVKFEAELAEGATGVRDAREKWTFERDIRSPDPNWRLARVSAA